MSMVAPKGRTHLCADALFRLLHEHFATIADDDVNEVEMPLDDALMSAFAMCSLKAPSLLDFDTQRADGNLKTIYGMERAPCDTRRRERLDPVSPESLRPSFTLVFRQLQRGKALEPMVFLDGHYLIALDGTGDFSSNTIHGDSCLHKEHRNGSLTYDHQMLGAAIIHPDFRAVIPLMPEPIVQQDGTEKNACARHAATRFITKLRQDHPHLKGIITEDALSANAPHIETLHDYGCHYILGVKEGDHAYVFKQGQTAEEAGRVTYDERHDRAARLVHRLRFVNNLPLNGSRTDVRVNFIEYWEMRQDQVQPFRWVTDLRVSKHTVYKLMRGGRARWKIDNATCNTLQNQGDNFEHNDGHGEQHLSVVFAMLMMLAFLVDQTQQLGCAWFRAVWAKFGSKRLLWERMRAWFYDDRLDSMRELLEALYVGFKKPHPLILTDSSYTLFICLRGQENRSAIAIRHV
jgi:hypothetical protein